MKGIEQTLLVSLAGILMMYSTAANASSTAATPALRAREPVPDPATAQLERQSRHGSLLQAVAAARYAVEPASDGGWYAGNPAHALRCWFRSDGLELQAAGTPQQTPWQLKLRLHGYGRETIRAADVGTVSARQNRTELAHFGGAVVKPRSSSRIDLRKPSPPIHRNS